MKSYRKILIVFLACIVNNQVSAIVVSDPGSYLYMVEEIAAGYKQIEAVVEGNVTSNKTLDEVREMNNQLKGSYNKTMGAIENAKAVNGRLKGTTTSMQKSLDLSKELDGDKGFKDMADYLDKVFTDPRYVEGKNPAIDNLRYNAKQRAYKNTVLISEKIMKGQKERLKALDNLSTEIDRTKNVKEATDLTNRMLVEIIRANIEMLSIQISLTEAYGLQNYTGLKEEDNKKQIDKLKGKKEKNPDIGVIKYMKEKSATISEEELWGRQ